VVTTDFFTPVVDDGYDYGSIAAANSLSDIYAMGGRPFLALNVAALPADLPVEIGSQILRGGAEKCREAGVVIAGGHTVQDKEPKYGLVAIGFADPAKLIRKNRVRAGDALVLTKPLGFGVTTTALKQDKASAEDIAETITWMKRLNREASALAVEFGLSGGTDVTGFSLLGHAWELTKASGVGLHLELGGIPFLPFAHRYAGLGTFPGGASDNRLYFGPHIRFREGIPEEERMLLFDPQTSGGLLLAVPGSKIGAFLRRAGEIGQPAWTIGEAVVGEGIEVD
jgi:selenide,water dikinase